MQYQYQIVTHMRYFRCHCGHCNIMPTSGECICCCEVDKVVSKMEETGASCITEHEGFGAVCLNRWVLQTAYFQYRQQYGNHLGETLIRK